MWLETPTMRAPARSSKRSPSRETSALEGRFGRPPACVYTLFTVSCSMTSARDVITVVMAKPDPRIETLERDIAVLVEQRQTLRAEGADAPQLERNRREIVSRQHELSETLISIYAPQPAFALA